MSNSRGSQAATIHPSACPHDCPSTCALEVEVLDGGQRIGRVRGAADNSYTAGVICAKVARYAERIHHPDRLTRPLRRVGPKGSGEFVEIGWDEAMDTVARRFLEAEHCYGPETVWPYYYAGTMGLLQRDGINRLRHAKGYSGFDGTICVTPAWTGWLAGVGRLWGSDPREMARSDLLVIWGTNPVATQVNVMTHAMRARKERGARIAVVDVYRTPTMEKADFQLLIRPGTDAALACAVMHVLFRDGLADREYLATYTDDPAGLEAHLAERSPEWAEAITGLTAAEIEAFARAVGTTPRSFFRLGYGFTRSRNGVVSMHAALCIPAVSGAWRHEGGGAFHSNSGMYGIDKTLIEGLDRRNPKVRMLDQSRIGAVLEGDADALRGGPPVTALLIQNTNPATIAPDQSSVRRGFLREDLFVCVHEQFMTETARLADIVLPATMFMEHDDIYQGGGHQHLLFGPKLIDGPAGCRSNHQVICDLARRLGADDHPAFHMDERDILDETLRRSNRGTLAELEASRFIDVQPDFRTAHFLDGFGWADGRFRFKPHWPLAGMPQYPDYWAVTEEATADHPFRLVTAPARNFLNSSFTETPTSVRNEARPSLMIHPDDAAPLGILQGDRVEVSNPRGTVILHAHLFDGMRRGVVIAESIWPNRAHEGGRGINSLTGADPVLPKGGAAVHDSRVAVRRLPP